MNKNIVVEDDKKEPKPAKVMSFRAPSIVQRQLEALEHAWGESTTHVIHRAIAIAHEKEFGKRRSS